MAKETTEAAFRLCLSKQPPRIIKFNGVKMPTMRSNSKCSFLAAPFVFAILLH